MGGVQLYRFIGIFQGDVIGDLAIDALLMEIGDPVVFVVLFDDCQEPCGQLIGKDVTNSGALFAVFRAISGFELGNSEG